MPAVRTFFLLALGLFMGSCASVGSYDLRPIPTFTRVPLQPVSARSVVARRAWMLYQNVAARQIAYSKIPADTVFRLSGVIVVRSGYDLLVRFVTLEDQSPRSLFDVELEIGSDAISVHKREPPLALPERDLAQWRAHQASLQAASFYEPCASSYMAAVIPDDDGGWLAYMVPSPEAPGQMELGGYLRLKLDSTGELVLSRERLGTECSRWKVPRHAVALVIAQADSRVPAENDVYASLFWKLPLYVSNSDGSVTWVVYEDGVEDASERVHPIAP